jgi:hypothetical protein
MNRNVVEQHPPRGPLVPAAHQRPALSRIDDHRHPMKLVVPGVEDVPTHPQ